MLNVNINWDAIAAIGQCAGALATFMAVIIALRQNKPKLRIKSSVCDVLSAPPGGKFKKIDEDRLYIKATNIGNIPIKVDSIGIKLSIKRFGMVMPEQGVLPRILMPSESVDVWTHTQDLIKKGVNEFDIGCATDSAGRVYLERVNLIRRITRLLWWVLRAYKKNDD